MNLRPLGGTDRGRVRDDLGGGLGDQGEGGEGDEGDGLHCDMCVYMCGKRRGEGRMGDERWMVRNERKREEKEEREGGKASLLFNRQFACRL